VLNGIIKTIIENIKAIGNLSFNYYQNYYTKYINDEFIKLKKFLNIYLFYLPRTYQ